MLYYLNDVEKGGETAFLVADNTTLDVKVAILYILVTKSNILSASCFYVFVRLYVVFNGRLIKRTLPNRPCLIFLPVYSNLVSKIFEQDVQPQQKMSYVKPAHSRKERHSYHVVQPRSRPPVRLAWRLGLPYHSRGV